MGLQIKELTDTSHQAKQLILSQTHKEEDPLLSQGTIIDRIMDLYMKIQMLVSLIEDTHSKVDEARVSSIKLSYLGVIDAIKTQAGVQLGTAIASGVLGIGSGVASPLLGKCTNWSQKARDNIGKGMDGASRAATSFGQVGTTYLEARKTAHNSDITTKQHRLGRIDSVDKSLTARAKQIDESFNEIVRKFYSLYHPAK